MKPTDAFDLPSLLHLCRAGYRPEFLFFWSHQAKTPGKIGKECLSQWWPAAFCVDGTIYATAEHYMMAEKARLFGDEDIRREILAADSPEKVKKLGRLVKGFDSQIWEAHRTEIVFRGNTAKFQQNADLYAYLMGTGAQVLVEASPYDQIWGIGLSAEDADALQPEKWRGLNLLGFALMCVRSELQRS